MWSAPIEIALAGSTAPSPTIDGARDTASSTTSAGIRTISSSPPCPTDAPAALKISRPPAAAPACRAPGADVSPRCGGGGPRRRSAPDRARTENADRGGARSNVQLVRLRLRPRRATSTAVVLDPGRRTGTHLGGGLRDLGDGGVELCGDRFRIGGELEFVERAPSRPWSAMRRTSPTPCRAHWDHRRRSGRPTGSVRHDWYRPPHSR